VPQKAALFARKSIAASPRVSRGAFLLRCRNFAVQGKRVKEVAIPHFRSAVRVAIAAVLCAAAPLRAQSPSPAAPAAFPVFREVTDEAGRTVRIPQPVRRIVSLAPSLTETVYALGLQDRLVGDTDYCDYPPDAKTKTKVGGAIDPSLEQIAALHPDLVLVTKGLNRLETVHSLDTLGIPSYATDPRTVEGIISSSKNLADVLGAPEAGASVAANMRHRLADLQERIGALPPKRVLFAVWTEPLISVGKETFIADALRRAGAVSIVDSSQDWPQVSLEEIARLQPDSLVFAASHSETVPHDVEALANLPAWGIIDAVRYRRYAVISDAVNRPAPRIVEAIEDLARQLHPEAFVERPESGKDKPEKVIPPPPHQSFLRSSFDTIASLSDGTNRGGYACAR
jgi:iron complex transport system substrate-binding protein